jgi:predicted RNA-binding protein with TRAM domain
MEGDSSRNKFALREQKDLIVGWKACWLRKTTLRFSRKDGVVLFRGEEGSSLGRSDPAAPVEVGGEYDVKIEDIAREGDGIARVEGFVIFVPQTKVGDEVRISIDKVMRRFAVGHKV